MTALADLFDLSLFDAMLDGGYVRVQQHPDLLLQIANYSEKAQYENVWNDVTLNCRGLIFNDHGQIVGRPYRKFFNYGDEANTGRLDLSAPVHASDKLDGSLGISYPTPDGSVAVATRGSFTSDQALHASEVLATRYADWRPAPGYTYLWEIVYPANRIVVDYGHLDDLILHGAVHIDTGRILAPTTLGWPGPRARQFPYASLAEALAADPRPNAEGMVVRYDHGRMVKLKQDDYVALHRIVTGLNAKTVWEWLGDGKTVGDLCATVPDDFHGWIESIAGELHTAAERILITARDAHEVLIRVLDRNHGDGGWTRGDYARAAAGWHSRPYMFLLLDGREAKARDLAWRAVKPSGARSLINHSEAVA